MALWGVKFCMMKEYIVSIKIGNYKTSAWVVGFDKRFAVCGDVLKLRMSNNMMFQQMKVRIFYK